MTQIQFAQITATNCELTKTFAPNGVGGIQSDAIAHMTQGRALVVDIPTVTHLSTFFALLGSNQAVTCGIPRAGNTALTTRDGAAFRTDAVARTNEAFDFPYGAALFPIDVDVDSDMFSNVDSVLDALEACSPWLCHVLRVARPSSSSYVGGRGLRGVHVYLAVTRGTDIPALAKRMQIEQWAAGRGSVKISKTGALLTRQLSDALVYQPSRLMFEAAPVLRHGVTREVPHGQEFLSRAPAMSPGAPVRYKTADGLLDVQAMPQMRDIETRRFETAVRSAKNTRRREAKRIAIDYQKANAIASGLDEKTGERYGLLATRALGDGALPAAWELFVKDIGRVKVADVLANLDSALGYQCADPFDSWRPDIEPKHCTKAEIVMMGDKPGVWSHKLQQFFAFTDERAADLSSPLDCAAEKLCGLIEYPEAAGKKAAPEVNVVHALRLLFDEIGTRPQFDVTLDHVVLDDVPNVLALQYALSRVGCANVGIKTIERACESLAFESPIDPWKSLMLGLPVWDKTPRLDNVFTDVCQAFPSEALQLTGQLLFASIVMRQLQPGAPAPVVPVLIGDQRCGKSRFVAGIAEAIGAPKPASIAFSDDRRMSMAARRSVVTELAEMSGMSKRDADDVKRWVTDDNDVYRKPYGKEEEENPRRFVPIGTANRNELNRDDTGNSRFMPVIIPEGFKIDPNWTVEVSQILAEAKARFCDDRDDYYRLVRAAPDAVRAYNGDAMLRDEGTPVTEMDDILPDMLRRLVREHGPKVKGSMIRAHLDLTPSGRTVKSRDYARWLAARGWRTGRSANSRYYDAPEDFVDNDDNKPLLSVVSPFTTEKTA